jgi:hypothetical protein
MKYKKIIIWGAKLDTGHTHAYIHLALAQAAEVMGLEVYWLDNRDNVEESFFDDALIISEQWLVFENPHSNKLPLRSSSCYVIHYVGNKGPVEGNPGAGMYLGKVGKLIDFRFACNWGIDGVEDKNYAYKFEPEKYNRLSKSSYYDKGNDYDYFYSIWATDLLPEQFNIEDRFTPYNEPKYAFFCGTIRPDNNEEFHPFIQACRDNNVDFFHHCPMRDGGLTTDSIREYVKRSFIALDARPKNHLANGYIPCRTFKNISYGKLGVTNSKAVYDFFDGGVAYSSNTYELFNVAKQMEESSENKERVLHQMMNVRDNHTYINRLQDIITASEI